MSIGFTIKSLFVVIFINEIGGIHINRDDSEDSNASCKTLVCDQAFEQADGLSKLALLDEFVEQTILLLNDLMKNIDTELEKTASALLKHTKPYCGAKTVDVLNEVIEKQRAKRRERLRKGATNVAIGNGIEAHAEHSSEWDDEFQGRGNTESHQSSSSWTADNDSHKQGSVWSGDVRESRESESSSSAQGVFVGQNEGYGETGSANAEDNSASSAFDHGSNKKHVDATGNIGERGSNSFSGNRNNYGQHKYDRNNHPHGQSSGSNSGQSWSQNSSDSAWKGSASINFSNEKQDISDSKDIGTGKGGGDRFTGKQITDINTGSSARQPGSCRGVGHDSVYWVPGLDQWCLTNCATGYCPQTHCVC